MCWCEFQTWTLLEKGFSHLNIDSFGFILTVSSLILLFRSRTPLWEPLKEPIVDPRPLSGLDNVGDTRMLLVEMSIIFPKPSGGDTSTRLRHFGSITLLKSGVPLRDAGDPDLDLIPIRFRWDFREATFGAQSLPDDFNATERRLDDGEPEIGELVDSRERSVCGVDVPDCSRLICLLWISIEKQYPYRGWSGQAFNNQFVYRICSCLKYSMIKTYAKCKEYDL